MLLLAWSLPPGLRGNDAIASFAASRLNMALNNLDMREEDDIMDAGAFSMPLADSSVMVMTADLRPWADPESVRKRLLDILVHAWADQAVDVTDDTAVRVDKMSTEANRWFSAVSLLLRAAEPLSTAAEMLGVHGGDGQAELLLGAAQGAERHQHRRASATSPTSG